MCGIAGFVGLGSPLGGDVPEVLRRMVTTLRHRGPDDAGEYRTADVALGHRRLSIIDLSQAGHQPMSNADGSVWLTYNGEIYNYRELDAALKRRGYVYRSQSDSETIIHAYEEWGPDCVTHLNGMFALAIWDARRRRLFCARDRFGEKPFYYAVQRDRVLFASEIKALLEDPSVPRDVDTPVMLRYLAQNFTDADASTFFSAVKSLPPAHTLIVEGGRVRLGRYWQPPVPTSADGGQSDGDWIAEFRDTFRSAVDLRLRSDVPVGVCLSGGLDSSSIVGVMSGLLDRPVSAFSVVYDDAGYREGKYVREVASVVPLDAHQVTPRGDDLFDVLPALVRHNDEPSCSVGQYSQWQAMKLAAEHGVTVILNGQGSDEQLGGYWRYLPTYARELARSGRLRQAWRELARVDADRSWRTADLKEAVYPLVPAALREGYRKRITRRERPHGFIAPDLLISARAHDIPFEPPESLAAHMYRDLTITSLPALLHHEDRASMAFSREIRLPFLDPRLAELAARMPPSLKIRNGVTKYVLRKAMEGERVPNAVLRRFDKKGYPTPVSRWFRTTALEQTRDLLASKAFAERGLLDLKTVGAAFESHTKGIGDYSLPIWQWVNLELWFQQVVERKTTVQPMEAVSA